MSGISSPRCKSEGRIREIQHGAAIIATGAEEYKPTEYLYGEDDRVLTQLELEEQIAKERRTVLERPEPGDDPVRRLPAAKTGTTAPGLLQPGHQERPEAESRSIPEMDIYILFRDMRTYGFKEDYYREAASKDVKFIRYEPEDKPVGGSRRGGWPADSEGDRDRSDSGPEARPRCRSRSRWPPRSFPRRASQELSPDCSRCR